MVNNCIDRKSSTITNGTERRRRCPERTRPPPERGMKTTLWLTGPAHARWAPPQRYATHCAKCRTCTCHLCDNSMTPAVLSFSFTEEETELRLRNTPTTRWVRARAGFPTRAFCHSSYLNYYDIYTFWMQKVCVCMYIHLAFQEVAEILSPLCPKYLVCHEEVKEKKRIPRKCFPSRNLLVLSSDRQIE